MINGKRMAEVRKAQRYSQRALAETAGVSPSFIAMVELGHSKNPTYTTLVRVAKALNVDPAIFFDEPA